MNRKHEALISLLMVSTVAIAAILKSTILSGEGIGVGDEFPNTIRISGIFKFAM